MELHAAAAREAISQSYVRRVPEHGLLHRVVREHLQAFLSFAQEAARPGSWAEGVGRVVNPFGAGDAAERIAAALAAAFASPAPAEAPAAP